MILADRDGNITYANPATVKQLTELAEYLPIPVDKIGVSNTRQTNLEYLGGDMIEAGNEFGAGDNACLKGSIEHHARQRASGAAGRSRRASSTSR